MNKCWEDMSNEGQIKNKQDFLGVCTRGVYKREKKIYKKKTLSLHMLWERISETKRKYTKTDKI